MRGVVQRVSKARVLVNERVTGEIGIGLVVLLGVAKGDTSGSARYLAEKTATVRIFADKAGKMNLYLSSTSTGPRSLFRNSPSMATPVASDGQVSSRPPRPTKPTGSTKSTCAALRHLGVHVQTGIFQTMMSLELTNEGPVTILLDSEKLF